MTGGTITVGFTKCNSHGDISGNNVGGICAGGDILSGSNYGGGCIGNGTVLTSTSVSLSVTFSKCNSYGTLKGKSAGGICGGGNSYVGVATGCIFNGTDIAGTAPLNFSVIFDKCSSKSDINGINSGGICGGGDTTTTSNAQTRYGGCLACSPIQSSANSNISINIVVGNCTSHGNIEKYGSGGICARYIGMTSPPLSGSLTTPVPVTILIQSCNSLGKYIGKKHLKSPYVSSNCGGILGGYVNGSLPSIKTTVSNCYSLGQINKGDAGICGTGNSSTVGVNLLIEYCYSAGRIGTNAFGISDLLFKCVPPEGSTFKQDFIIILNDS